MNDSPPPAGASNEAVFRERGAAAAILRWSIRAVAVLALAVSTYLAWIALSAGPDGKLAGCGGSALFDCDAVLGSRWATWLGVPVSLPAVLVYGAIIAATVFIEPSCPAPWREWAWRALLFLGVLAAGAGVWFVGLMIFKTGTFCPLCLAVHTCGLATACLVLAASPIRHADNHRQWLGVLGENIGTKARRPVARPFTAEAALSPSVAVQWGLAALVAAALLPLGQAMFPPSTYRIEQPELAANEAPLSLDEAIEQEDGAAELPDVNIPPSLENQPPAADSSATEESPAQPASPSGAVESSAAPASEPPVEEILVEQPAGSPPDSATPAEQPAVSGPSIVEFQRFDDGEATPALPSEAKRPPSERPSHQLLPVLGGKIRLDTGDHPMLGHPGAEYVVVDLFDYTCHHCRTLHHQLGEAQTRYGGHLAVMALPVPMNTKCNSFITDDHPDHRYSCHYAKLALAVWRLEPKKFVEFHHWLLDPEEIPQWEASVAHAAELVGGQDVLAAEFTGEAVRRTIRSHTFLYRWAGGGVIPKLLIGEAVLVGETRDADELCGILEERLGIAPSPARP